MREGGLSGYPDKDATCARDKLVEALRLKLGKVIGYKAGLTAKPTQERFNASAPVAGVLLEAMILKDGTSVPADYGARPVWEGDMLLVVKDEGINQAKTPEEALRHLSAMRPFIELPDLALAPGEKLDGTRHWRGDARQSAKRGRMAGRGSGEIRPQVLSGRPDQRGLVHTSDAAKAWADGDRSLRGLPWHPEGDSDVSVASGNP